VQEEENHLEDDLESISGELDKNQVITLEVTRSRTEEGQQRRSRAAILA
jgi:hypothetical protein